MDLLSRIFDGGLVPVTMILINMLDDEAVGKCRRVCKQWNAYFQEESDKRFKFEYDEALERYLDVPEGGYDGKKAKMLDYIVETASSEDRSSFLTCVQCTDCQDTPFLEAADSGLVNVMKLFLDLPERFGFDACEVDRYNSNAMHLACCHNHYEAVKLLLEHPTSQTIDLNSRGGGLLGNQITPLILAIRFCEAKVVQLLLLHAVKRNISLNVTDSEGNSPLYWAMITPKRGFQDDEANSLRYSSDEEKVKLLLASPLSLDIDFNATNDDGTTIFHEACRFGRLDSLKLLMEHPNSEKINLNAPISSNSTHWLTLRIREVFLGHSDELKSFEELLEILSKRHIDFNIMDPKYKRTPLHFITNFSPEDFEPKSPEFVEEVIRIILKHPSSMFINLDIADKKRGRTVLHNLCYEETCYKTGIKMLLKHPAGKTIDFTRKDKDSNTALQAALLNEHFDIVDLISMYLPDKRRKIS